MSKTVTDQEVRDMVLFSLGDFAEEHDVDEIVQELMVVSANPLEVSYEMFWEVVDRYAL